MWARSIDKNNETLETCRDGNQRNNQTYFVDQGFFRYNITEFLTPSRHTVSHSESPQLYYVITH